jgi:glycosyltransferase involved in cell wall biosynthesis
MKILMLIDSLGIGGAETHVEALACELSKLGHSVCVVSSGGIIANRMKKMGIKNVYLPPITHEKSLNLPNLLNCLKNLQIIRSHIKAEAPDIVHAHTRKTAFLVDKLCKKYKIPLVVTAHALFSMNFPKNILSKWGDATIAVSDDIKNHLITHNAKIKSIKVINNGVKMPPKENKYEKNNLCQPS